MRYLIILKIGLGNQTHVPALGKPEPAITKKIINKTKSLVEFFSILSNIARMRLFAQGYCLHPLYGIIKRLT